jgi:hypothetical protein
MPDRASYTAGFFCHNLEVFRRNGIVPRLQHGQDNNEESAKNASAAMGPRGLCSS